LSDRFLQSQTVWTEDVTVGAGQHKSNGPDIARAVIWEVVPWKIK